jgi:hypothetical protein
MLLYWIRLAAVVIVDCVRDELVQPLQLSLCVAVVRVVAVYTNSRILLIATVTV